MLVSIALVLFVSAGGFALTYFVSDDETFLWRSAAGAVIGSAVYGTLVFVIGCFAGIGVASLIALAAATAPLLIFLDKDRRRHFRLDWQRAKNKMQGGSGAKLLRFTFYAFFLLLFCLVFSQTMYLTPQGIFTGGSNNLGDLPFHLGAIFSFTDGGNLPPVNPSYAGAKFSYPFIADIATAGFIRLGADLRWAMIVQDVVWAFALLVVVERFAALVTGDRLAGRFAPWLLFFSGGLGFVWFFSDYLAQARGFFDFLNALPRDYTIGEGFRWGNSIITLFITQRSILLGMPLTVVVLQKLWEFFTAGRRAAAEVNDPGKKQKAPEQAKLIVPLMVGLIAGMLPLVHLHSLAVLFIVTAFLFAFCPQNWRVWTAFGVGVAVIAVPELLWSATGTATRPSEFFEWWFGWDKDEENFVWFWIKNVGLVIPLIAAGAYLFFRDAKSGARRNDLLYFYAPFVFCFIISNAAKLAPWQWDNIKVLIYWYVGSLPLIAYALSLLWKRNAGLKALAAACFATLVLSGALDVYRTASGQVRTKVFDADAVRIAEQIKAKTPANALFLNAATYNTAIALTGRRSLMRYSGHLSSHGIDYRPREADVETIYRGGPAADELLARYNIDYVLVSPEETGSMTVNREYFMKFRMVAQTAGSQVFQIK